MANIIIKLLDQSFEEELFKFEVENRFFFEKVGFQGSIAIMSIIISKQ